MCLELLLYALGIIYLFYKWATWNNGIFADRGIPYDKPAPLVGSLGDVVKNKSSLTKAMLKLYNKYKQHKIFGFFLFREPVFVLTDLESIKKITIKDFSYFPNHHPFFPTSGEPIFEGMLNIMKDQRWKNMRNTLSPVFTTAKMRAMYTLMAESFQQGISYFQQEVEKGCGAIEIDIKNAMNRLSNDLIATTAFGLKVNSFKDSHNEFYSVGQSFTSFRKGQMLTMLLLNFIPASVAKLLGLSLFGHGTLAYFKRLVTNAIDYREKHQIVRPDMINLLMEAKKEAVEQHWTDDEIVAQCLIFFFAAFENNSNLTCAACHELCLNAEVQQKLYEECAEVQSKLQGAALDYDTITKMKYMDMVISETLRKFSLASITDRVCSKDYTLTDEDGNVIIEFKKGDRVIIPIVGIQLDEQYFKNANAFVPERFSEENKDSVLNNAYLAFGAGPRICIGNRYALMQAKAMLYNMILEFEFKPASKTVPNIIDDLRGFQASPNSGFWVKMISRKK